VFNNEDVFQDTLKIRKGRTARIFMETRDLASVLDVFLDALDIMETKVPMQLFVHVHLSANNSPSGQIQLDILREI
jgi:hypothetical protein